MLTRLASVSGTLAQTSLVADFGGFLQVCTIKVSHSGGSLQSSSKKNLQTEPLVETKVCITPLLYVGCISRSSKPFPMGVTSYACFGSERGDNHRFRSK